MRSSKAHDLTERVKVLGIENMVRPSFGKVSGDSKHHNNDRGNAHASYRNVLQGDCPPTLTRELSKPEVFCVYGPTLGDKPWYQLVHPKEWK